MKNSSVWTEDRPAIANTVSQEGRLDFDRAWTYTKQNPRQDALLLAHATGHFDLPDVRGLTVLPPHQYDGLTADAQVSMLCV